MNKIKFALTLPEIVWLYHHGDANTRSSLAAYLQSGTDPCAATAILHYCSTLCRFHSVHCTGAKTFCCFEIPPAIYNISSLSQVRRTLHLCSYGLRLLHGGGGDGAGRLLGHFGKCILVAIKTIHWYIRYILQLCNTWTPKCDIIQFLMRPWQFSIS